MFNAIDILAHGLSAQRLRMNTIVSNIANAQTTRTEEGGPYKRRDVVLTAREEQSKFSSVLDRMTLARPKVSAVIEDQSPPREVHQPGHPDADAQGIVRYPNINIVSSMSNRINTATAYEAQATATQTVRDMMRKAAQITIRF